MYSLCSSFWTAIIFLGFRLFDSSLTLDLNTTCKFPPLWLGESPGEGQHQSPSSPPPARGAKQPAASSWPAAAHGAEWLQGQQQQQSTAPQHVVVA